MNQLGGTQFRLDLNLELDEVRLAARRGRREAGIRIPQINFDTDRRPAVELVVDAALRLEEALDQADVDVLIDDDGYERLVRQALTDEMRREIDQEIMRGIGLNLNPMYDLMNPSPVPKQQKKTRTADGWELAEGWVAL